MIKYSIASAISTFNRCISALYKYIYMFSYFLGSSGGLTGRNIFWQPYRGLCGGGR